MVGRQKGVRVSSIRSIATAVPTVSSEQSDTAREAARLTQASERRARAIEKLYNASGVDERHLVVASESGHMPFFADHQSSHQDGVQLGPTTSSRIAFYEQHAPRLAYEASEKALREAGIEASDISHLVMVSCTGLGSPGVDHRLIEMLGLSRDVQRTFIGFMGCHGAINGLRAAEALTHATGGKVLLCCVELCSLHFQYAPGPGAVTANALFADGAGACVLTPDDTGAQLCSFASRFFPNSDEEMSWRIGDHGFEMTLLASVPGLLQSSIGEWVQGWLKRESLNIDDIDNWVIHPGGPKIIEGALDGLGLTGDTRTRAESLALGTLRRFGNMSSPTVLFMLKELLDSNTKGTTVCLAFGPGLSGEAALIRS